MRFSLCGHRFGLYALCSFFDFAGRVVQGEMPVTYEKVMYTSPKKNNKVYLTIDVR